MYFIPRNNAFYNYIAHTNVKRRYAATLFIMLAVILVGFYGIYKPLNAHIDLCTAELRQMQQKYQESEKLKKNNSEIAALIDTNKKNIEMYAVDNEKKEAYCNERMQFIFDTVAQLGLTLSSYSSCKEKDRKWYVKDLAHCQITGSLEKIVSFFKVIKESLHMIKISSFTITKMKDNLFQLSCDIGIITVKK
jgi:Tfp pilus assembly protein PilO